MSYKIIFLLLCKKLQFCIARQTGYRHFKIFLSIYFYNDCEFFSVLHAQKKQFLQHTQRNEVHGQLLLPKIYICLFFLALNLIFDDKILNVKYFIIQFDTLTFFVLEHLIWFLNGKIFYKIS